MPPAISKKGRQGLQIWGGGGRKGNRGGGDLENPTVNGKAAKIMAGDKGPIPTDNKCGAK